MRQIGSYCSGSWSGPDYYYSDYEPAYLDVWTYQQLYQVEFWDRGHYTGGIARASISSYIRALVHPLDAEPIEEEYHNGETG